MPSISWARFSLRTCCFRSFAKGSRIVTVASSAHFDVDRVDWDNLPQQRRYDPWEAYSLSKFGNVIFTAILARNLEGTGIIANCLHPGIVKTRLSQAASPGLATLMPEEGAETPVWLATSADIAGVSGYYFEEKQPVRSSTLSRDRRVQERLWKMAESLTGINSTS